MLQARSFIVWAAVKAARLLAKLTLRLTVLVSLTVPPLEVDLGKDILSACELENSQIKKSAMVTFR